MDVETIVKDRYSAGAKQNQQALCCPIDYDSELLKRLLAEILEKDYGYGDPSRYVRPGDTVLDLGNGGGKICYMATQLVGPAGRVIGVDMTDEEDNIYYRGERMAVSDRTCRLHTSGHYQDDFIGIEPPNEGGEVVWQLPAGTRRAASDSKTLTTNTTQTKSSCCC